MYGSQANKCPSETTFTPSFGLVYDDVPAIKTLREAHCTAFSGFKRVSKVRRCSAASFIDSVEPSFISKAAHISFGSSTMASISKPVESR